MKKQPTVWYIGPKGDYSEKIKFTTIQHCYDYCKDKMILAEDIETQYKSC